MLQTKMSSEIVWNCSR